MCVYIYICRYIGFMSFVIINIMMLQDFLLECDSRPSNCRITFDNRLLQLGLIICFIKWPHLPQSYDSHVTKIFAKDCRTEEFHAALERYHHEVNTGCWLCSSNANESEHSGTSSTNKTLKSSCLTRQLSNSLENCTTTFPSLHPSSIAYLLHTTGTTGHPKLVQVPHCCVVPNIVDLRVRFAMSPNDVVVNAAPLTFDPSVVEVRLVLLQLNSYAASNITACVNSLVHSCRYFLLYLPEVVY